MIKSNNLTPNSILKALNEHKKEIDRYSVKKIGLFGSFLKGKQHKRSDLDFLVVLENPTFDNYMELKFFLEKLFNLKVDLVLEDSLKPALKYIKREVLYAK